MTLEELTQRVNEHNCEHVGCIVLVDDEYYGDPDCDEWHAIRDEWNGGEL